MLESRIGTTEKLAAIMEFGEKKHRHYISASAIGIYPEKGSHNERSPERGTGFMSELVVKWEQAAMAIQDRNTVVTILRTGVVLSHTAGIMKRLLPFFRLGLGGKIAGGQQYFSWIHIEDMLNATSHIIETQGGGIYNMVSPGHCTNEGFAQILGDVLKKPALMRIPAFPLRLLYGNGASLVIGGQAAIPERLLNEGFNFKFPGLEEALRDIVN
jgi:uncharacterized protein (TIGR01777 family)